MKKGYFYNFSGTVYVESNNIDEAEKSIIGIPLDYYLIDEDVFEVDENYVATDLKIREQQFGTAYHPLNDPDEFELYKIRKFKYNHIFNKFINGKIDKKELIDMMEDAEDVDLDDCELFGEVSLIDLESKREKTVRLCSVE